MTYEKQVADRLGLTNASAKDDEYSKIDEYYFDSTLDIMIDALRSREEAISVLTAIREAQFDETVLSGGVYRYFLEEVINYCECIIDLCKISFS